MAKYEPLQKSFWADKDVKKLGKDAKWLLSYIFTNQYGNNSGIYELPIQTISEETKISRSTVEQLLVKGSIKNVHYDMENEIIFVQNRRKYKSGGNPKQVEKGIISEFKQFGKSPLWNLFIELNPYFKDIFSKVGQPLTNGSLPLPLPLPLDLDSKDLNINNKPLKIDPPKYKPEDFDLAKKMREDIKAVNSNHKFKSKVEGWADEIRIMREQDDRSIEDAVAVWKWANAHTKFWQATVISPSGLRRNFDKIKVQMTCARASPEEDGMDTWLREKKLQQKSDRT